MLTALRAWDHFSHWLVRHYAFPTLFVCLVGFLYIAWDNARKGKGLQAIYHGIFAVMTVLGVLYEMFRALFH